MDTTHSTQPGGNRRLSAVLGGGALLPAAVLELGLKLCVALREAYAFDETDIGLEPHERELRPENVLLSLAGDVVSGDLGLPAFGAPHRDRPLYRSPEEVRGGQRDHRSDVFVLGALIWQAAVGEPFFDGPTGADARFALEHGLEGHLVLKDVVRTADARIPGLGAVLERCLREDPEERYPDPAELGGAVAGLMGRSGLTPGSLAKRVAMTPAAREQRGSRPGAPAPAPPIAPLPPAAPPPRAPASADRGSAGPSLAGDLAAAPGAPGEEEDFFALGGLPPEDDEGGLADQTLDPLPPARPPAPPTWLNDASDDGPSVELDLGDLGRKPAPEAEPRRPTPPPPLATAGARFALQSELEPDSTWNRANPSPPAKGILSPAESAAKKPVEKVPLKRTERSLKRSKEPKEETFLGAVRWFFSRVLLYAAFLATVVFALAWFDVFPNATRKAADRAWEATPEALRGALPEAWAAAAVDLWGNRVGAGAGSGIGEAVVQVVPEDVARSVEEAVAGAPPAPTPVDAGTPGRSGIVVAVAGWAEPVPDAPAGEGWVQIDAELDGRPLGEAVRVALLDPAGTVLAEGASGADIAVLPGEWTARLTWRASEAAGDHVGEVVALRAHAGHRSRYRARIELPVGLLDSEFLVDAVDVSPRVVLRGWPEAADPEADPAAWTGSGGADLALPAGRWHVLAAYDDGKHAPTGLDLGTVDVPPQLGRVVRKRSLQMGEQLDPTGPGVDIEVTNFGEDVSGRTEIYAYRSGDDVRHATAVASGRGAYYFDLPPGTYDLRLVFAPYAYAPDVVGEKIVTGVGVPETGVQRPTVDVGFEYTVLDVAVDKDGEDVSSDVRAVIIGPGASFEGATRVLDADLGRPLPIVAGTWDIYLIHDGPGGEVRHHFPMVDLRHGKPWRQRFSLHQADWVARP
jgi:hypothetical protein